MTPRIGQRVIVTFPDADPPTELMEVIDGPVFRHGKAVCKVQAVDDPSSPVWVPTEWIGAVVRVV
jgi:hypothetical protein